MILGCYGVAPGAEKPLKRALFIGYTGFAFKKGTQGSLGGRLGARSGGKRPLHVVRDLFAARDGLHAEVMA